MTNTTQEPDDFLPLTPTEFHIMLVLADDDLHGYGIMQRIETQSGGTMTIGPGMLYTTIKRLLERGWIAETDPPADAEDSRRKYYRLTPFGNRVVRAEALRLATLVDAARTMGLIGGAS